MICELEKKFHETNCKNRAVLYRKNSRTVLLKVACNTFLALSHGETGFMKPNLMKLVPSCDMAISCLIHFHLCYSFRTLD